MSRAQLHRLAIRDARKAARRDGINPRPVAVLDRDIDVLFN